MHLFGTLGSLTTDRERRLLHILGPIRSVTSCTVRRADGRIARDNAQSRSGNVLIRQSIRVRNVVLLVQIQVLQPIASFLVISVPVGDSVQCIVNERWIDWRFQERTLSLGHPQQSILDANPAMDDHVLRYAVALHALEDVEVASLMMSRGRNGTDRLRIPDKNIRIRARSDTALARVDIEDFGRICTGDGNEPLRVDQSRLDTFIPDDGHPVLDTVDAVRNLSKVAKAEFFLVLIEGAVIAAGRLQIVPEFWKRRSIRL